MTEHVTHHSAAAGHGVPATRTRRRAVTRLSEFVVDSMIALPAGCIAGLIWANTLPDSYFIAAHSLAFAVNEIGMAFFLAIVVKEVVEATLTGGVLHPWRRAALPVVAAAFGFAVPVLAYAFYLQQVGEWMLLSAWVVPGAVDIAGAYLLARAIFGRGPAVPFLLLMAIASNAIGLIALTVSHPIRDVHVVLSIGLLTVGIGSAVLMKFSNVRTFWPYILGSGAVVWAGLYFGGVHPALALVPIVPFIPHAKRDAGLFVDAGPAKDALTRFGRWWTPPVQVVLLLFGLISAGVPFRGLEAGTAAFPIATILGRPIGTLLGAGLAVLAGLHLPHRVGWRELTVIGCIASIGVTMALFFASIALPLGPLLLESKMGALLTVLGAIVAVGVAGLLNVGRFARHPEKSEQSMTMDRRMFIGALAVMAVPPGKTPPPAEILILRHAEEPAGPGPHLNDRGRARAAALPKLFPSRFVTPTMLIAARSSRESVRSVETIEPLAAKIHVTIDDSYALDQYEDLAKDLLSRKRYSGAHVLICWHHANTRELAAALGVNHPPNWPERQYDHIWQIRFSGRKVAFSDQPQQLLPGDDGLGRDPE